MRGMGRYDFRAAPVPEYEGFGVRVWMRLPEERRIVTNVALTVEDYTEAMAGKEIPPALDLSPREAQSLMDALWYAGARPSNGEGSTGRLAATENHLADMRRLVFAKEAEDA